MDEIAAGQAADMQASVGAATRAAEAMEDVSAGIGQSVVTTQTFMGAQQTFGKLQMRPYVSVCLLQSFPKTGIQDINLKSSLIFIILGTHTCSQRTFCCSFQNLLNILCPENFQDFTLNDEIVGGGSHINHGGTNFFRRNIPDLLTDEELNIVTTGQNPKPYIWGTVWFDDVFGNVHHTNFFVNLCILGCCRQTLDYEYYSAQRRQS